MISTEADVDDRTRAFRAGANGYLVKPVRPERLLTQVRLFLGEVRP
jgi:two-component system chemotaxis response regulator CheY